MNYCEDAMICNQISLISHADWSKNADKRWVAVADLQINHRWLVFELSNVSEPLKLFFNLKSHLLKPGFILSGFDFPISLPFAYAAAAGIIDFLKSLRSFGQDDWGRFYIPAELPTDISVYRPFYPNRPDGKKHSYIEEGLSLPFDKLYRLCEIGHDNQRSACPLFWTLGGQQVGKAAISGWSNLLTPVLVEHRLRYKIWPFSGQLAHICQPENNVVVETYPAEFYGHLGLSFSSPSRRSKCRRFDRITFAEHLNSWAETHNLDVDDKIMNSIIDGFGNVPDGEDRFDALIGLYGMINVVLVCQPGWEPNLPRIAKIEAWIFRQAQPKGEIIGN